MPSGENQARHGHKTRDGATPTYSAWQNMKNRCKFHEDYVGRILVCDRWIDSFENFLQDMGEHPGERLTLERIDNDDHYRPGNCVWATYRDQRLNQRVRRCKSCGSSGHTANFCGFSPAELMTENLRQEVLGRIEHGESRHSIRHRLGIPDSQIRRLISGELR